MQPRLSGAAAVLARAAPAAPESGATLATRAAAALEPVVGVTVASPKQTRYRNKATFFFSASDDGDGLVVGSKAADDPGRVVPIGAEGCPLQAVEADAVLASLATWAKRTKLCALDVQAAKGGEGVLEFLLGCAAEVDACNGDGDRPLHLAAWMGFPDVVERLLEADANPDALNEYGHDPLDNIIERAPVIAKQKARLLAGKRQKPLPAPLQAAMDLLRAAQAAPTLSGEEEN